MLLICVAKTKMLISCAVTAQLICAFVFAYASRLLVVLCGAHTRVASRDIKCFFESSETVLGRIGLRVRKPTLEFPTKSDTNRPVQSKKQARILKFCILIQEGLHYP